MLHFWAVFLGFFACIFINLGIGCPVYKNLDRQTKTLIYKRVCMSMCICIDRQVYRSWNNTISNMRTLVLLCAEKKKRSIIDRFFKKYSSKISNTDNIIAQTI